MNKQNEYSIEELYQPEALVDKLSKILAEKHQGFLAESAGYTFKEIIGNAVKATAKRAWFMDHDLDMDDPSDYAKGLPRFRSDYFDSKSRKSIEETCRMNQFRVTVGFTAYNDTLTISVENIGTLTADEKGRIDKRIAFASRAVDSRAIIEEILDESEGAGLGLILSVKMLCKNGLPGMPVQYFEESGMTRFEIILPDWITPPDLNGEPAQAIRSRIDYLPNLPSSLVELMNKLNSDICNFSDIEKYLQTDPGLSANILRCANSPLYMNKQRISTLEGAVKIIGFLGIKRILYFSGAVNAFSGKIPAAELDKYTRHSFRVAAAASYLARKSKTRIDPTEAWTMGLLHDLGILVLLSERLTQREEILMDGYEHDRVGYKLASHWNFPEPLQMAIKYHHHPDNCHNQHRDMAELIYMADKLSDIGDKRIFPGEINPEIFNRWEQPEGKKGEGLMEECLRILEGVGDE